MGIRDQFERLLSGEDAPAWKPDRAAYDYAAGVCGVAPEQLLLVAVHRRDIDGAALAGMGTAWVNRTGASYPGYLTAPDYTGDFRPMVWEVGVVDRRAARAGAPVPGDFHRPLTAVVARILPLEASILSSILGCKIPLDPGPVQIDQLGAIFAGG